MYEYKALLIHVVDVRTIVAAYLSRVPEAEPTGYTRVHNDELARLMLAAEKAERLEAENHVLNTSGWRQRALDAEARVSPPPERATLPEPQSVTDYKAMVREAGLRALIPYVHRKDGFATHNCDFEECQIEGCPTLRSLLARLSSPERDGNDR